MHESRSIVFWCLFIGFVGFSVVRWVFDAFLLVLLRQNDVFCLNMRLFLVVCVIFAGFRWFFLSFAGFCNVFLIGFAKQKRTILKIESDENQRNDMIATRHHATRRDAISDSRF